MTDPGGPPPEVRLLIERIVSAVRKGDDTRVQILLCRFAHQADMGAAFMLRQRLLHDPPDGPGSGTGDETGSGADDEDGGMRPGRVPPHPADHLN
ncbi:hypothetical protein ACH4ZX_14950 [Streptomyces sp. NPDC020490]|uniref:hypothetical protein n=1 Tax=Streptomyces sp. NPDC020490 TaxID=3365078 RepID=UPI0037B7B4CD